MIRVLAIWVLAGSLAVSSTAMGQEDKPKFDPEKMVGTWLYESGKRVGEDVPAERLIGEVVISKESFKVPAGPTDNFVMTYKLDTEKNPVSIDLKIKEGPVTEGAAYGIIKIEEGKVVFCYHPEAGERPKKFESTAENGCHLFVLKKKP